MIPLKFELLRIMDDARILKEDYISVYLDRDCEIWIIQNLWDLVEDSLGMETKVWSSFGCQWVRELR